MLLAFVVTAALLFLWYGVFMPPSRVPPPAPTPQGNPSSKPPGAPPQATPLPPTPPPEIPAVERQTFTLDQAGLFKADFDSRGATLAGLSIQFPADGKEWVRLARSAEKRGGDFLIEGLEHVWAVDKHDATEAVFVTRKGGLQFRKSFSFASADRYVFKVMLEIENVGAAAEERSVRMQVFNGIEPDTSYRTETYLQGVAGFKTVDRSGPAAIQVHTLGNAPPEEVKNPDRRLAGVKNRYFALLCIPRNPQQVSSFKFHNLSPEELKESSDKGNMKVDLTVASVAYRPNEAGRLFEMEIYAGPIRKAELAQASENIGDLLVYGGGCFTFFGLTHLVGTILLWVLNAFQSLLASYGVSIVFTTFVMRLCMFPLSWRGQLSMQRMQKLQPKIQMMRDRYKHDPQRGAQEQWKLFREHKVSPMGGCLPMLIQLPIFLGMYSVLDISVDLRHSPFLWAKDLSEPDRLYDFGRTVHILFFSLDAFNLLPLVMTVAWVLQSMTMPKAEDPNMRMQQKMMTFMPILFGFLCYNLPSGLSWYFFVNSTFAFFEQKLIKRMTTKRIAEEFPGTA